MSTRNASQATARLFDELAAGCFYCFDYTDSAGKRRYALYLDDVKVETGLTRKLASAKLAEHMRSLSRTT